MAVIIEGVVSLIVLAAWVMFIFYFIRKWRRRNIDPGPLIPPDAYGAWQGHNLGTTTMEPGELTKIERNLNKAAKDEE
ncbi:MAG TPA: hypothetical protein VFX22_04590 [Candidatus Kapabacteria bacterium]|nr:hypothetical protein [Candidatus Kapabacteria bacterium]